MTNSHQHNTSPTQSRQSGSQARPRQGTPRTQTRRAASQGKRGPGRRKPRRRIRWNAVIIAVLILCAMVWGVRSCCVAVFGHSEDSHSADSAAATEPVRPFVDLDTFPAETPENILDGLISPVDRAALEWDNPLDSMPDDGCVRLRTNIKRSLHEVFNDSNHLHLAAAEQLGINPLRRDGSTYFHLRRPLVKVASCADYYIAPLSHSYPYLVPEAEQLLRDIGHEFRRRLHEQGGGDYRIKVTSLLRSPVTVGRLRRVNVNSVDSSAHIFATTFDISFSRFACDRVGVNRTCEDLKLLLADILVDMRDQGRCYVKHERKQSCFHITTRPRQSP